MKSVQLAIDLATRHRDDAGKALAQIHRTYSGARDQMEQLESYAADTESKWAIAAQVRAAPEIVRHYDQFMGRLQQAIELQRNAVADRNQEFIVAKKFLLAAEIRIASLTQMLQKKQSGIARVQAGREQRQLDEFAAMQHRRRLAGGAT